MKIKELLGYLGGFIIGFIITRQFIIEFNPHDIISWLFAIPVVGFDTLFTIHFIKRLLAEYKDD